MQKALRRLANGEADGIIAARLDRLTRRVGDLGKLLELAHAQEWNLVAIDLGVDLTGKMVANILGTLAEWELDRRRESWAEARGNATERGAHIGTVPAGYDRIEGKLVPNRYSQHIVSAFEMRAAGLSITEIGSYLRESGVPSDSRRRKSGTVWSGPGVRSLLCNRTYLGEVRSGEYVNQTAHPAIIEAALFSRVQRVNPETTRKRTRGNKAAALLQGSSSARRVLDQ
jgi:hypothetical protein